MNLIIQDGIMYFTELANGANMSWVITGNWYEVTFYYSAGDILPSFQVPLLTPARGTDLISELIKEENGFFTHFFSGELGPRGDYPVAELQIVNGTPGLTYIRYD